jgi:ornithine--oxo-acid transaminase
MNRTRELIEKVEKFGAHNYKPLPVVLSRGEAARVWDVEGNEYLDFLACYSALNFGHQHPRLIGALEQQVRRIAVTSRAFHNEELCHFSEELARFCQMDMVLTMNSGAEAVESAIKIARKWGYQKKKVAEGRAKIVAMTNNFHGRTVTLVSFSTEPLYRTDFGPFTPGFEVVPFGDFDALEKAVDENTVGILMEPIQAEAGILLPPAGYLKQVRELCTKQNVLMILDEIQTGLGRTGRDFCFEHDGIVPDMVILGKSLGGGLLPLSAVVSRQEVMRVLRPGEHGSTFGGNPLACAVGREVLKLIREEKLSERSDRLGKRVMEELRRETLPNVREIRGRGALIGIEMTKAARPYCERLAEKGVLCKETHDYVIRIAPPLVISEADLSEGVKKIVAVIRELS